jgi:hypothetical protein
LNELLGNKPTNQQRTEREQRNQAIEVDDVPSVFVAKDFADLPEGGILQFATEAKFVVLEEQLTCLTSQVLIYSFCQVGGVLDSDVLEGLVNEL